MTTNGEHKLDLELKRKKIKLLEQYTKIFDLLSPRQKKRYVQCLPESAESWKREFCKDCNECYACKESPAHNLGWFKILPACFCDRCYELLMSGRWKEFYGNLANKKVQSYMTYYACGISLPSFEKETDD